MVLTCGFIVLFPAWIVFGALLFPLLNVFAFVISFVPMMYLFKFAFDAGIGANKNVKQYPPFVPDPKKPWKMKRMTTEEKWERAARIQAEKRRRGEFM